MRKPFLCAWLLSLALPLRALGQATNMPAPLPHAAATAQAAAAPAPTSAQFAAGVVRGQVSFAGGLDLEKPDLARAVVYLESTPALDALSTTPPTRVVAQLNKAFVPNFSVISKGTTVEFPNWDRISHNVFSRSAAAPAFDLDRYPYGMSKSRVFAKVGVVQVFCNVHPWMRAIIFVTPNRFFARADTQGRFDIDHVPPGHYLLSVWQQRCAIRHQAIDVAATGETMVSFVLHENRDAIIANDPPRHDQKYGVERGLGLKRQQLNLPVVTDSHPAPTTQPCYDCQ